MCLLYTSFLEKAEGKNSDFAEKQFVLAGGGILNCPILTSGGYGAEIQYQGVKVLSNLGNGWGYAVSYTHLDVYKRQRLQ